MPSIDKSGVKVMGALPIKYYTYEDYLEWEGDWELIDGIAYAMSPGPARTHQHIATEIIFRLREQISNCFNCEVLGEIDYKISNDTVVRPDIILTYNETSENYLTKTPLIIFEIISPSSAMKDEIYKFKLYEMEKVKYYALVYPNDLTTKVYKLKGNLFDKEGIFSNEVYRFTNIPCEIALDFEKVFQRPKR